MRIVTLGTNYPNIRLVLNSGVEDIEYKAYRNFWNPVIKKVFHTYEVYKPIFEHGVDGYHAINTIMLTEKP